MQALAALRVKLLWPAGMEWPAWVAAPLRWAALLHGLLAREWQRLPLWLPVAMGAGVAAYFNLLEEPGTGWLWLPWPLLALAVLLLWRFPLAAWATGLAGAAALGFALAAWHTARLPPPLDLPSKAVMLEGVVEDVDALPEGVRVTLAAARLGPGEPILPRQIRIRLRTNDPLQPMPGDHLRVRALVREPAMPAHPGAWDFQRTAFFQGLGGSGFALGSAERLGEPEPASPFARLRRVIEGRITAQIPGGAGAVSSALITGSQTGIPKPDMAAMRDSGLAHLLSVSGLHIAVVMGLGFGVIRFLVALVPWLALRVDSKVVATPGSLLLGLGYVLLTGGQVPMLRSFAMAAVVTLGVLIGRRALSLRTLSVAAFAVMAIQPAALTGPSFQMSFAAVMALIAGAEWSGPAMARWRAQKGWWRKPAMLLIGLTFTSILAGLATTPYGLHHFGRLQLYGVAANAVAIPLTSILVMPAGMAAVALMPFGLEAWPLILMGWGVEGTLLVARTVAAWPGAAMLAAPIPVWGLILTTLGMLWLCLWQQRWRLLGVPLMLLGISSAAWVTPPDILVSSDARLIAFRTAEGVVLQRASGASALVRESWLRGWGEEGASLLPAAGDAAGGAIHCDAATCAVQLAADGPKVLLLRPQKARRGETAAPLQAQPYCGQAALLLSPEPIRGRCRGVVSVDRFSVWRNGPHAIWLSPEGVRIVTDRDWRGARPWVPPQPVPAWQRAAATPEAP
ncbi:ComEC/Rec2 family competence protein [Teichococcus aerophilus]|nr:ComEC/Rec2 family competence protein [Pseudoroseomonas aerophila]